MVIIFLLLCFYVVVFFITLVRPVQAQVLINEVYPNPLSGETEWVEILNTSTLSASLEGWVLEDKLSSSKVIYTFDDILLSFNQYYLASISGQLNNGGDGVVLKNSFGEVVTEMDFLNSTSAMSWALQNDGSYILDNPSPLRINEEEIEVISSPTPSPTIILEDLSDKLELVSVMSCPDNSAEWFELKNTTDHSLAQSLYLIDAQNNRHVFEIDILPSQEQRFYIDRHILNNSGDSFTLVQEVDNILFSYKLPACKKKDIEFHFINGLLTQLTRTEGGLDQEKDDSLSKVLGTSSEDEMLLEKEVKKKNTFQIPSSYIGKVQFQPIFEASSEALIIENEVFDEVVNEEDHALLSVTLVIFGGIILSFLGIMYFYGNDWIKDKTMD
jgi:hypothetical protein